MFDNPLTARIAMFLGSIGIEVRAGDIPHETFLPGVEIHHGGLLADESKLTYPGDLLHEAGHLAVIEPARRLAMHQNAGDDPGEEMAAIAWSYAAALHIGLEPAALFHAGGYKGWSETLLENFAAGRPVGVPMLMWLGLTAEGRRAEEMGVAPYPHMIRWLCEERPG